MKIVQGMALIKEKWVVKPQGFRVRFQKLKDGGLVTEYSPDLSETLLDSDVVAWRYAWKLWVSTRKDTSGIAADELVNITVVDEKDRPVKYYATNRFHIYNEKAHPVNDEGVPVIQS